MSDESFFSKINRSKIEKKLICLLKTINYFFIRMIDDKMSSLASL